LKAVEAFHPDIENHAGFMPNDGERYHHGERISTGCVESTVNQVVSTRMVKKPQMPWTKRGAHLLLQMRTRVLNDAWEEMCCLFAVIHDQRHRAHGHPCDPDVPVVGLFVCGAIAPPDFNALNGQRYQCDRMVEKHLNLG
jgi:hypothetical protein